MSRLVDSNLIIRFLLKDDPKQSPAAKRLFENPKEILIITDVTIAEVVWVLTSFYKLPKSDVTSKLKDFLAVDAIHSNKTLLSHALTLYGSFSIDFIDAYHVAYTQEKKFDGIYSFDKDLDKIKITKRFEP